MIFNPGVHSSSASQRDALGRRSSAAARRANREGARLEAAGVACEEVDGQEKSSGMVVEHFVAFFVFLQLLALLNCALQSALHMGPVVYNAFLRGGCKQELKVPSLEIIEVRRSPKTIVRFFFAKFFLFMFAKAALTTDFLALMKATDGEGKSMHAWLQGLADYMSRLRMMILPKVWRLC